ncbi:MAG: hypothetical protein ABFD79_03605 [Phycisphaerales bacterium]
MKPIKFQTWIVCVAGLFVCLPGCAIGQKEPSLTNDFPSSNSFPLFYDKIDDISDYVLKCQIPQGGLCRMLKEKNGDSSGSSSTSFRQGFMTTYCFGGTALIKAYQMTGKKEYLDGAKKFIDFWFQYQNKEKDRFGVVGTFYDKYIDSKTGEIKNFYYDEKESVSNKGGPGYDASDADGPAIAWTAWQYYKLTGDREFLEQYRENFKLILKSMQATMDSNDCLTWCHPNWPVKYLMDVCEVWAFLNSLENIFTELQENQLASDCHKWQEGIRNTINSKWWNAEKKWYYWYQDNGGNQNKDIDWHKWYPDAAEQIWPLLWSVTSPSQNETKIMWDEFSKNVPNWPKTAIDWPMFAYIAAMMNDYDKASTLTANVLDAKLKDTGLIVNDCYFVILNCCIDFDLTGSLHLVGGSLKSANNSLGFSFTSISDGSGEIILKVAEPEKTRICINGKLQINNITNNKIIIPVKMKAGEVKEFTLNTPSTAEKKGK